VTLPVVFFFYLNQFSQTGGNEVGVLLVPVAQTDLISVLVEYPEGLAYGSSA
jgi:hypothetical protein